MVDLVHKNLILLKQILNAEIVLVVFQFLQSRNLIIIITIQVIIAELEVQLSVELEKGIGTGGDGVIVFMELRGASVGNGGYPNQAFILLFVA